MDYSDWVDQVLQKAERLPVLFVQLGHSNEPARRALTRANVTLLTVTEYLIGSPELEAGTIVVDKVESLASAGSDLQLGPLRERVLSDVEAGLRFILLSRAPRIAFPDVVGSSLLDDASFAHAPAVSAEGAEQMPTCVEDGVDPGKVLEVALSELGPEVCASLDRVLNENMLIGSEALGLLSAREVEALEGAGLVSRNGGQHTWNFGKYLVPLKRALDEVLSDVIAPQQQLTDVSAGLWKLERLIRREVRRRAVAAWGDTWRSQCLNGDLPDKVFERAVESAYLGAASIKQLRDPLEWLSLGELLGLRDRKEIGDLGLSPALWRQFGAQIVPIRNRLAHMRTLRPEDSADVVKWLRVLELKLEN
jgi:hypothetical protein